MAAERPLMLMLWRDNKLVVIRFIGGCGSITITICISARILSCSRQPCCLQLWFLRWCCCCVPIWTSWYNPLVPVTVGAVIAEGKLEARTPRAPNDVAWQQGCNNTSTVTITTCRIYITSTTCHHSTTTVTTTMLCWYCSHLFKRAHHAFPDYTTQYAMSDTMPSSRSIGLESYERITWIQRNCH